MLDAEDYNSATIFDHEEDYPVEDPDVYKEWKLKSGNSREINTVCKNGVEAERWTNTQITKISTELNLWRKIKIPEGEEVTI